MATKFKTPFKERAAGVELRRPEGAECRTDSGHLVAWVTRNGHGPVPWAVFVTKSGGYGCTCPSFVFHYHQKFCKHTDAARRYDHEED